jgi:high-affinity iron transporter
MAGRGDARYFCDMLTTLLIATLATAPALAGDADRGATLFKAKCTACHGLDGAGDGPAARALPQPPPDLTAEEFWTARTEADVRAAITYGVPGGVMRAFPMEEVQLDDMIAFLQSLRPPAPAPTPTP